MPKSFSKEKCATRCGDMLKGCSHDVIMMGTQKSEPQLFNYAVNLEKRVRSNHPLRRVKALIDFSFVREEVARTYGRNGNESVPPEVIMR